MKFLKIIIIALFVLLLGANSSLASTFTWQLYAGGPADKLTLYRSVGSLTCEEAWDILDMSQTSYTIGDMSFGHYFFTMTASSYSPNITSDYANEIIIKYCANVVCQSDFSVTTSPGTAYLEWEPIDSIGSYQLKYKKEGDSNFTIINGITGNSYSLSNLDGSYTFILQAVNSVGFAIEANNTFPTLYATVSNFPPPSPPDYKIEAFGANGVAGDLQTVMIAFNSDDSFIDYYVINLFSSSALALSGSPGDLLANVQIPKGQNFCQNIDTMVYFNSALGKYRLTYPIIFATIASVDYNGLMGDAIAGYVLVNNITGTDNDNVPFASSINNTADLNVIRYYYYKYIYTHRSTDYCNESNLFQLLPLTLWERADTNHDGVVNGAETNLFGITWGETGAGK